MKKKILSVLLCAMMLCTLMPLNVSALPSCVLNLDCNGGAFSNSCTNITLYAQWLSDDWADVADTDWYDVNTNLNITAYRISTARELAGLSKLVSEGNDFSGITITLADDISLDGREWIAIGHPSTPFRGIFEGAGHTISGLYINAPDSYYHGLFGSIYNASVKNLTVTGSITCGMFSGGIVGWATNSIIENCVNKADIIGDLQSIGGIVGKSYLCLISDCCNLANISMKHSSQFSDSAGGIVGENYGFISNCYNIGDISGCIYVGGIAGKDIGPALSDMPFTDPDILSKCVKNIYNCYNIGAVKCEHNCYASGICGYLYGTADSCYNIGILESGDNEVAGIANTPHSSSEKVTNCYYLADCNGLENTFCNNVGTALSSAMFREETSFSGFDFENTWEMAPLAPVLKSFDNKGTSDNPDPIANLEMLRYMRDTVNSNIKNAFIGHYIVLLKDIDLECDENNQWEPIGNGNDGYFNSSFDGKGHIITGLYINKPDLSCVGFFGDARGTTIKNLGVYGSITGYMHVGGIAGRTCSRIENCFNACDVTGSVGSYGIARSFLECTFTNCYNLGNITCKDDYCGGITGGGSFTDVYNCYNFGTIDCKGNNVDPILITDRNTNNISNCYYLEGCNANGTVFSAVDGITALSASAFTDKSNFAEWDFDNVWDLSDSNIKRPVLKQLTEKGFAGHPYKITYTDNKGGQILYEVHYAAYNEPTPACKTDLTNLTSWKFVKWEEPVADKVTKDITYVAMLDNKASNTVRYNGNGGFYSNGTIQYETTDSYWNSDTFNVTPRKDFIRENYELIGWNTSADGTGTMYQVNDTVDFEHPHNGDTIVLYAIWHDVKKPVITGLEENKTYCGSIKFKVTDNDGLASVKVGDETLVADSDGYYTYSNINLPNYSSVTITATDLDGNIATISVTFNPNHLMGAWINDGTYLYQSCSLCGAESDYRIEVPEVNITGADTVCRNENYTFTLTLPDGWSPADWKFTDNTYTYSLQSDGSYLCVFKSPNNYGRLDSFEIAFPITSVSVSGSYMFITKTVQIVEPKNDTEDVPAADNTSGLWLCIAAMCIGAIPFFRKKIKSVQ